MIQSGKLISNDFSLIFIFLSKHFNISLLYLSLILLCYLNAKANLINQMQFIKDFQKKEKYIFVLINQFYSKLRKIINTIFKYKA